MRSKVAFLSIVGVFGSLAVANAQAPPPTAAFDGTYGLVSSTKLNDTYVDRNGRTGPCPDRVAGPLAVENGRAQYTNATGYRLEGTIGPQGQLAMRVLAPNNSNNAGSQPLDIIVNGTIDSAGTARVRQSSHSCSYDFVWQKQTR